MVSCYRCGRRLTNPDSIARGFGPICWGKIQAGDTGRELKPRRKWPYPLTEEEKTYIKCITCEMPMFPPKSLQAFEKLPCAVYCCACCPYYRKDVCPREQKYGGVVENLAKYQAPESKAIKATPEVEKQIRAHFTGNTRKDQLANSLLDDFFGPLKEEKSMPEEHTCFRCGQAEITKKATYETKGWASRFGVPLTSYLCTEHMISEGLLDENEMPTGSLGTPKIMDYNRHTPFIRKLEAT